MKNTSLVPVLAIILATALGCGLAKNITEPAAKPYVASADNFSITFPEGAREVSKTDDASASADNKVTIYSTVKENVGYRVKVILRGGYSDEFIREMTIQDINNTVTDFEFPWVDKGTAEPDYEIERAKEKEITFKGLPALEASGVSTELDQLGRMFKRQVLVWVPQVKRAYSIEVFSKKRDELTSKPVNDFFDSFKIDQVGN